MRVWVLSALLLAACKTGTHGTDTKSSDLKTREERIAFVKDYLASPSAVEDAEFHIVFHDNSGGLLSGSSDSDLKIIVRVKPDAVSKWAMGCTAARLDVRPPWVAPLLKGKPGWDVRSQPDTYRCGREERVIHVHEGVIIRHLVTE